MINVNLIIENLMIKQLTWTTFIIKAITAKYLAFYIIIHCSSIYGWCLMLLPDWAENHILKNKTAKTIPEIKAKNKLNEEKK